MTHTMPKQIGDYNKNQMLSLLRERGPTSRVELAKLMGISQTAISRSTSRLLENGIIRECEAKDSVMGRKPVPVELCGDFCHVLAADIVGGTIRTAIADFLGVIVDYHEEHIVKDKGANAVMDQVLRVLRNIIAGTSIPREKIWGITIGTPGIFDPGSGKSRFTFFMDKWDDIDIRSMIYEALSIDTLIENDVNLDVLGESWKGVGKDYENILYVKLGQGLASRVVLGGNLLRGEHNMAGEIGYMMPGFSGAKGRSSLNEISNYEHMLCNSSASRRYGELTGGKSVETISDLCAMSNNGDKAAGKVMDNLLDQFSVVLSNSITVLDPQVVILGGDACNFGEKEITHLKRRISQFFPITLNIIPSLLKKQACLYGAIKMSLDRVETRITDIW